MGTMRQKVCIECGEYFWTVSGNLCSGCKVENRLSHGPKNSIELRVERRSCLKSKICARCSKSFMPLNSRQLICSADCVKTDFFEKDDDSLKVKRFKIFERDGFRCIYCGRSSIEDGVVLQVDHVFPRNPVIYDDDRKYTVDEMYNLVTSCRLCNAQKSNGLLSGVDYERIAGEVKRRTNSVQNRSA